MIKKFSGLNEALSSLMADDRDYILVRHALKAGEEIGRHYHPRANEWVITEGGKFVLTAGDGDEKKKTEIDAKPGEVIVVHFPPKARHGLRAGADVSYLVLRDRKDRIVYVP